MDRTKEGKKGGRKDTGGWLGPYPARSPTDHRTIVIQPGQKSRMPTTAVLPSHAARCRFWPSIHDLRRQAAGAQIPAPSLPAGQSWLGCLTLWAVVSCPCKLELCISIRSTPCLLRAAGGQTACICPTSCESSSRVR